MKYFVNLLRILVGCLFIFSGFVKAVDPLGTAYKMIEYFEEFENIKGLKTFMHFLEPHSTAFSVIMIMFELLLGVALLLGWQKKITLWLLLAISLFFTFLTGYTFVTNHVTDCGCFGDFLKISTSATFEKDLVLLVLVVILMLGHKYIKPLFSGYISNTLMIIATIASLLYCFSNFVWGEPQFDFRPYKVGNHLPDLMIIKPGEEQQSVAIFIYKDTVTGEVRRLVNSSPDGDHWKMLERKDSITKPGKTLPVIANFDIENDQGDALNDSVLNNKNYSFIVVAWDLSKTDKAAFEKLNAIDKGAEKDGYKFFAISASKDQFPKFRAEVHAAYPFYFGDGVFVKTIMRSNPGLLLLKDGTVIAKWHKAKLPSYEEIREQYLKK